MLKPHGMGPFGRSRRRWKDNIEMYVRKTGCDYTCIDMSQGWLKYGAFVITVVNL